jgi:hypothetical protein
MTDDFLAKTAAAFGVMSLVFIVAFLSGTNLETDRIRDACIERNGTMPHNDVVKLCEEIVK